MAQDLDFKTLWQKVAEDIDGRGAQGVFRDTNIEQRYPDIVRFLQELRQASNNRFQFDCSLGCTKQDIPPANRTIIVKTNLPGMYSSQSFTTLRLRDRDYVHYDSDAASGGIGYWSAQGLKRAVLAIAIDAGFLNKSPDAAHVFLEPDPSPRLQRHKPTGDQGTCLPN